MNINFNASEPSKEEGTPSKTPSKPSKPTHGFSPSKKKQTNADIARAMSEVQSKKEPVKKVAFKHEEKARSFAKDCFNEFLTKGGTLNTSTVKISTSTKRVKTYEVCVNHPDPYYALDVAREISVQLDIYCK